MIKDVLKRSRFKIIVKPNSKKNEITGYDEKEDAVKINIAAPADKNKAKKICSNLNNVCSLESRLKPINNKIPATIPIPTTIVNSIVSIFPIELITLISRVELSHKLTIYSPVDILKLNQYMLLFSKVRL